MPKEETEETTDVEQTDEEQETTEEEGQETTEDTPDDAQNDAQTFPREYVEKLRAEAAEARTRAKRTDALEAQLFTERVRATGRLADPTDLAFNAELLDDPDALTTAIDTLLGNKPHLASRTPRGDVGQGSTGASGDVDLAAMLRAGA